MKKNMVAGVVWGIIAGVVISLFFSGVFAYLIINERLSEDSVFWLGLAITLISALIGCLVGTGVYRDKALFTAATIVAGYTLITMLIGFVGFGNIRNVGFLNVPMSLIAGASVCLLRAGKGRSKYR